MKGREMYREQGQADRKIQRMRLRKRISEQMHEVYQGTDTKPA